MQNIINYRNKNTGVPNTAPKIIPLFLPPLPAGAVGHPTQTNGGTSFSFAQGSAYNAARIIPSAATRS